MMHYIDIIILLIVVVLLFQRLKQVLGTRPQNIKSTRLSEESAAKIFDIIMQETDKQAKSQVQDITPEEELSPVHKAMLKIPGFNEKQFLNGAKRAFEVIITAFSKADTETLEVLVAPKLAKKFQEILEQRKNDGITAETDLISFSNAEITDIKISKSDTAKITVKFVTEQVNILKNAQDEIIAGDENFVQNITDIWTFERALSSTNPNWILISTKK